MTKTELAKMKKDDLISWIKENAKPSTLVEGIEDKSRVDILELAKNILDPTHTESVDSTTSGEDMPVGEVKLPDDLRRSDEELIKLANPQSSDEEWTDFVLSKLRKNEKVEDKYPTCDGLRRLFKELVGPIIEAHAKVIEAPHAANNNRATVEFSLRFERRDNRQFDFHITEVADCFEGNTKAPYCYHPTATAATMAEARALRKGLGINVHASEEMNSPSGEEQQLMNDSALMAASQKNVIINLTSRLGLDREKLLELLREEKEITSLTFDGLTHVEAQKVLSRLNKYQQGPDSKNGLIIPDKLYSDKQ